MTDEDQSRAREGTLFIPFSQFPPKHVRKDCVYQTTPAMVVPSSLKNMHSCEVTSLPLIRSIDLPILHLRFHALPFLLTVVCKNWLPRRVMSAWRVAGIVHALEGWDVNECGNTSVFDVKKAWDAALLHDFRPLPLPTT